MKLFFPVLSILALAFSASFAMNGGASQMGDGDCKCCSCDPCECETCECCDCGGACEC